MTEIQPTDELTTLLNALEDAAESYGESVDASGCAKGDPRPVLHAKAAIVSYVQRITTPPVPSAAEAPAWVKKLASDALGLLASDRATYQHEMPGAVEWFIDTISRLLQEQRKPSAAEALPESAIARENAALKRAAESAHGWNQARAEVQYLQFELDDLRAQLAAQAPVIDAALAWVPGKNAPLIVAINTYRATLSPAPAPQEEGQG